MEIRVGINTEFARRSYALTLEEPDILALLIEAIQAGQAGEERERALAEVTELRFALSVTGLKAMAENEAYIMLLSVQVDYQAMSEAAASQDFARRTQIRADAFAWVRRQAGVPEAQPAQQTA
jgi:hypothetical protein